MIIFRGFITQEQTAMGMVDYQIFSYGEAGFVPPPAAVKPGKWIAIGVGVSKPRGDETI